MPRLAAFLGSVNVGGNRVVMADLVAAMVGAGFARAETVVASGNVLFDGGGSDAAIAHRIEAMVEREFGFAPFVAVRTGDEVAAAIAGNPFGADGNPKAVHTMFLERQPSESQFTALVADHAGRGSERLALGDRALLVDFATGVAGSKLTGGFIAKRLGGRGTARNLASLARIRERMG